MSASDTSPAVPPRRAFPFSRPTRAGRLLQGVGLYLTAGLLTLGMARWLFQGPPQILLPLLVLAIGAALPPAIAWFLRSEQPLSRPIELLSALIMVAALILAWFNALPNLPYGDGGGFTSFITSAYTYPRWLVGSSIAVWLYVGFWTFPSIAAHLPVHVRDAAAFLHLLCPLVMGLGSIAILRRWPDRLAATIPIVIPIWLLFASGYIEYYPLMIGAWLAALLWTFERPLHERPAWAIGALAGILPAVYVPLVGFSVLLVVVLVVTRPSKAIETVLAAAGTLALALATCWPGGVTSYLHALLPEMNLGEQHMSYVRYLGRAANPWSIFFSTHYAFIHTHLVDLAYMTFWGIGWLAPLILVGAGFVWLRRREDLGGAWRDARVWLGASLVLWQLYYFVYMIPRMGPTGDIDLFCPTYVTLAFVAGAMLDAAWPDRDRRRALAYPLLCALLGVALVTTTWLAWIGLPTRL